MKIKLFAFGFIVLGLFACQTEQDKLKADIEKLEANLDATPTIENAEALVAQYQTYMEAFPEDTEAHARYLYRAAGTMYRMNRFTSSIEYLKKSLKDYYDNPNTVNSALLLGNIYEEKLRNTNSANTVYQAALMAFPNMEKAAEVKEKIPATQSIDQRLELLGRQMFNDSTARIDYRIANDFVNSCELKAMLLPNDPKSPEWLHKAGEAARSIRSYAKALEIYEWISDKFPSYEKAPQALFLRAFTLDNDLKRFDEAKALYEEFLQKYPNDDFADDTQFLLNNLGKNDEEIINSFEQTQ